MGAVKSEENWLAEIESSPIRLVASGESWY